ncbi:MAG: ABC transporter permease subunit, partial [Leptospiraceae bacterium]|nr:ABC transporter permease subunit [Leptospiraceae bacterium]
METIVLSLRRIATIFALTFRESIRRRLLIVFIAGCLLMMLGGGSCAGFVYNTMRSQDATREEALVQQRKEVEEYLARPDLTPEARQEAEDYLTMISEENAKQRDEAAQAQLESMRVFMIVTSFAVFIFWLYLLATFFIPFIAMNDFYTGAHILLLSSPVRRWEYLLGKYLANYGMILFSMLLMLAVYFPMMYLISDDPGLEILWGMPQMLLGVAVYAALMVFLSISLGRLPAIFVAIFFLIITIVPNIAIASQAELTELYEQLPVYILGYGFPQLTINALDALSIVARESEAKGMQDFVEFIGLYKIGNNTDFWAT